MKNEQPTNKNKQFINIEIGMAEDNVPENIEWTATNTPVDAEQQAKAFILAFWDGDAKESLRMDLWTKEMMTDEMTYFVFQTMNTLAGTYHRATNDKTGALEIQNFCLDWAEKRGIINRNLS